MFQRRRAFRRKTYGARRGRYYRRAYKIMKPRFKSEFKSVDVGFSGFTSTYPKIITPCQAVELGSGSGQRIGRNITPRSVYVQCGVLNNTNASRVMRMIVFTERQTRDWVDVATSQDSVMGRFFEVYNPETHTIPTVNTVRDLDHTTEFRVLYDKKFVLSAQGQSGDRKELTIYKKLYGKTQYQLSDNVPPVQTVNGYNVYVMVIAEIIPQLAIPVTGIVRMRYTDN